MIRTAIVAASLIALGTTPAFAAPCRDAKGHFAKCTELKTTTTSTTKSTTTSGRCRDAKGHFAKCGTPGAKPA